MATHSSILAQRIPWTEEPGRLKSMVLQTARHDLATKHHHLEHSNGSRMWNERPVHKEEEDRHTLTLPPQGPGHWTLSRPLSPFLSPFFKKHLFFTVLGLGCCTWAFSSCSE